MHEDSPINKVVECQWRTADAYRKLAWHSCNVAEARHGADPTVMNDWLGNGKRNPVKKWWLDQHRKPSSSTRDGNDKEELLAIAAQAPRSPMWHQRASPVCRDETQPADRVSGDYTNAAG